MNAAANYQRNKYDIYIIVRKSLPSLAFLAAWRDKAVRRAVSHQDNINGISRQAAKNGEGRRRITEDQRQSYLPLPLSLP
jgi:hypothetical protein